MNNIDLRLEYDQLVEDYGHEIRYARKTTMPCTAEVSNHDLCKECLGTGVVLMYETHTVRRDTATIPETWPGSVSLKSVGDWQVPAYIYYMRHDSHPETNDLIIDSDKIYEIKFPDPLRGDKGRIEYYRVAVLYKITKQQLL
jgi:hypothetical protein